MIKVKFENNQNVKENKIWICTDDSKIELIKTFDEPLII